MTGTLALGREIIRIVRVGGHLVRDALGDPEPSRFETGHLGRIVGEQPHVADSKRPKH